MGDWAGPFLWLEMIGWLTREGWVGLAGKKASWARTSRDKGELDGTSGEGSSQQSSFNQLIIPEVGCSLPSAVGVFFLLWCLI